MIVVSLFMFLNKQSDSPLLAHIYMFDNACSTVNWFSLVIVLISSIFLIVLFFILDYSILDNACRIY